MKSITERHLLGYDPLTDTLPLVLSHCNYSLHLGQDRDDAELENNYQGFELQIMNTLLLGKKRVQQTSKGGYEVCASINGS